MQFRCSWWVLRVHFMLWNWSFCLHRLTSSCPANVTSASSSLEKNSVAGSGDYSHNATTLMHWETCSNNHYKQFIVRPRFCNFLPSTKLLFMSSQFALWCHNVFIHNTTDMNSFVARCVYLIWQCRKHGESLSLRSGRRREDFWGCIEIPSNVFLILDFSSTWDINCFIFNSVHYHTGVRAIPPVAAILKFPEPHIAAQSWPKFGKRSLVGEKFSKSKLGPQFSAGNLKIAPIGAIALSLLLTIVIHLAF